MSKLVILRGASGSGKSTYTQSYAGTPVVVSRDALRKAVFGSDDQDYYTGDVRAKEKVITDIQNAAIEAGLKAGRDVIVDNTNVEMRYVQEIANIGFRLGADLDVVVFPESVETCLLRNRVRAQNGGRDVPEHIIRKQHAQLQSTKDRLPVESPKPEPYMGTPGKPKAFMFDLDGTLFHMNGKRGPYDLNVDVDDIDWVIADIIFAMVASSKLTPIAMSGRKEVTRAKTVEALNRENIPFKHLFMRADGDDRKDAIVKLELFNDNVRDNYDVLFVLEDRNQVVELWRAMNIKTLQVAEGDF